MPETRNPIEVLEIGEPGNPDAIYFRFSASKPVRSLQPDPDRFVFLEVAADGRLVGVLTYQAINLLMIERCEADLVFDRHRMPVGVADRYRYETRFDELTPDTEKVVVDRHPCGAS